MNVFQELEKAVVGHALLRTCRTSYGILMEFERRFYMVNISRSFKA